MADFMAIGSEFHAIVASIKFNSILDLSTTDDTVTMVTMRSDDSMSRLRTKSNWSESMPKASS